MKDLTVPAGIRVGEGLSEGFAEARTREALGCIETREQDVRAFVDHDALGALAQARGADRTDVSLRGPLHGVCLAVKEIFDVDGLRCTFGSPLFTNRIPAKSATLVTALREAGAIILGTTVSTEFAIAAAGPTRNPWDTSRTPGGSSSGSAAAVATGMVDLALGSQTIGSIIRPAAYCGVIGFKPTQGLIAAGHGMLTLSPVLDHVGFLASDIEYIIRGIGAVATAPVCQGQVLTGVCRVARWFPEPLAQSIMAALDDAFRDFRHRGVTCREHGLPSSICMEAKVAEALLLHDMRHHLGNRISTVDSRVSPELRHMLHHASAVNPQSYQRALVIRDTITRLLHETLRPGEVFLAPATLDVAPPIADGTGSRAPQRLWTLCGMPAISVPMGMHDGLPVAVQLVGRRGEDGVVLAAAQTLIQTQR